MRALLLFLICLTAAMPAMADPPDPPDTPVPMPEDVHRPRTDAALQWFAEIGVGGNYTFMSPNGLYRSLYDGERPEIFQSASGLGLLSYAAIGVRLSPLLSIVLRNDYDQKSASRSEVVQDTVFEDGTGRAMGVNDVQKDYDLSITYETLSLMAELNFDDLIVYIGPSVGIPLTGEFNENDSILAKTDPNVTEAFYFSGSASQTKRIGGSLTVVDSLEMRFSVKVGLGYSIELAPKWTLIPRVGYDFGFTNGLTEDLLMRASNGTSSANLPYFIQNDFKLSSIQASIGVRFTP